jgi:RNAse (barnase) inhibitor barstar
MIPFIPVEISQPNAPWFYSIVSSRSDLTDFCWSVANSEARRFVVRLVRGHKMKTVSHLFDEFAAAFQFPYYFGENWAALSECLADLSWLPAEAYLLIVENASDMLPEDENSLRILINVLTDVASEWSMPIKQGGIWDRPGRPFHVILHASDEGADNLRQFLKRLGVQAVPLASG